jgi:hypothetical protein
VFVVADNPEHAARLALGEDLVRGSGKAGEKKALRARVYIEGPGGLTLVRLYSRIADEEGRRSERERTPPDRWGD